MNYDEMKKDLDSETSGGGTRGVYEEILENGQVIVPGHRKVRDRIEMMIKAYPEITKSTFLDLGCNLGSFVKHFSETCPKAVGIDYNAKFIKWAKAMNPKGSYHCVNFNNSTVADIKQITGVDKFDVVCAFSVWDYMDPDNFAEILKGMTGKVLFFEGHADGAERVSQSIMYNGKRLYSWKHIFENILKVDYELLGWTADNTRPFYICRFRS